MIVNESFLTHTLAAGIDDVKRFFQRGKNGFHNNRNCFFAV
ncbi:MULTISPECIES: hypothetical protein [unclassified Bartonella]